MADVVHVPNQLTGKQGDYSAPRYHVNPLVKAQDWSEDPRAVERSPEV